MHAVGWVLSARMKTPAFRLLQMACNYLLDKHRTSSLLSSLTPSYLSLFRRTKQINRRSFNQWQEHQKNNIEFPKPINPIQRLRISIFPRRSYAIRMSVLMCCQKWENCFGTKQKKRCATPNENHRNE